MPKRIQYKENEIIGNNKILYLDEEKTSKTKRGYWICECLSCGKIRSVRTDKIKNNTKCQSCASKIKKHPIYDDLANKKFGYWLVLEKGKKANYWKCKCLNCGTINEVFRGNLTNGNSKSCGCINSWGEKQIEFLLNKYFINHLKQYTFSDLVGINGHRLRFDFAIFDKYNNLYCLIEYDGRQHFKYDSNWHMSKEEFKKLQDRDKIKDKYCKNKNITLFRFNSNTNLEECIFNIYSKLNK